MSAWIVDKRHIDVLVGLAIAGPRRAPKYPGDGYHGPSWFAEEPSRDWSIQEYNEHSRKARLENADEVGRMLLGECIASVKYRYHDEPIADLPGNIDQNATWDEAGVDAYRYQSVSCPVTAVEGLSAIGCYEYQSCEHPGWDTSEAKRFCSALRGSLIHCLDGFDAAPWGWDESTIAERRFAQVVPARLAAQGDPRGERDR